MFDEDRFHNTLALSLGYERLVKDKRITIQVEDSDDPWVSLKFQSCSEIVKFKASEIDDKVVSEAKPDIKIVMEAVYHAYVEAIKQPF